MAPGHNSVIRDEAGQDWMFYHAIDSGRRGEGRVMLMDKIVYKDGWPVVGKGIPSETKTPGPVTVR
jgi:arabinan endo-1,5-alpha-L-arabinosidase